MLENKTKFYDTTHANSSAKDTYLPGTPEGIAVTRKNKDVAKNDTTSLTDEEVLKYLDYKTTLANAPVISAEPGTRSIESRYEKDLSGGGAVSAFRYGLKQFQKSETVDEAANTLADIIRLEEELEEKKGTLSDMEEFILTGKKSNLESHYKRLKEKIDENIARSRELLPSDDYLFKQAQAQADPRTGLNPLDLLDRDELDFLDFLKYEVPTDLAGSYATFGTQLLTTFGPAVLTKVAAKALTSLKVPNPLAQGILTTLNVVSVLFSAYGQKVARDREAAMEGGSAYEEKLNEQISKYVELNNKLPDEATMKAFHKNAYEGLEQLRDVTSSMIFMDYLQTAAAMLPTANIAKTMLGGIKGGRAIAHGANVLMQIGGEAFEEGKQGIAQMDYENGSFPENVNNFEYWWDINLRTTKALLGVGDPTIMNDEEWGNSVRSGMVLGGGHTMLTTGKEALVNIFKYNKDKRVIREGLVQSIDDGQSAIQAALYGRFYKEGRQSDLISILNSIKGSQFAKENELSDEYIDNEITKTKKWFNSLNYLNSNKLGDLNDSDRVTTLGWLINNDKELSKADKLYKDNEEAVEDIYSNSDLAKVKGSEFVAANRISNRIEAIKGKLEYLSKLGENDPVKKVSQSLEKFLKNELVKATEELNESELKGTDLSSIVDQDIIKKESALLDAMFSKEFFTNEYNELTTPDKLKAKIADYSNKREVSKKIVEEAVEKEADEIVKKAEERAGKAAIVYDDSGSAYKLVSREGNKFKLQDVESGNEFEISKEEAEQVGMKLADNDQPIDDIVLFTDRNGNEYAYAGKEGGKYYLTNLETGKVESFTAREFKQAGFAAREEILKQSNKDLTPEQIVEKEAKEQSDKAEAVKAQKQAVLSTLMGEDGKVADEATLAEMDRLIKENGTFFNITIKGTKLVIEGKELTNNNNRPTDAVIKDSTGKPVAIVLTDSNGKSVRLVNKYLVADLATTIAAIENVRLTLFKMLRESKEAFLIFKGTDSKYEYYVYMLDGEYVVLNPKTGKRASRDINNRVINQFLNTLDSLTTKGSELKRVAKEQGKKLTTKELKDELKRIDSGIRRGTPEEIINAKSAGEIPVSERPAEEKPSTVGEQDVTSTTEEGIINTKAEELVNNTVTPQNIEPTVEPDTDRIDPNELSLPSNLLSDLHGLRDLESSLAYNADDNPEFDKWISNPNLSLEGYYVEFEVDYSVNSFWNDFPELKSAMRNGKVADSDRSAIFATSKAAYNHFIDQVPIKAVLKDRNGNAVKDANLYIHKSDFGEIKVPTELINDKVAKADYRIKERNKLRNRRDKIIADIINGNKVTAGNLKRTKGKPNSRPAGIADRNSAVNKVFKGFKLGVADSNRIIRKQDGTVMTGMGEAGNVFAEVKALNGELYNLKLNPTKLSEQHARIVLSALLQAYKSKDGYSTMYDNKDTANRASKGDVVGDLTVGEVLYYLVLEGKNFTDQSVALHPKAHLKAKQLWVEEHVLHYGVDGLLNIDNLTETDVNKFLRWATGNKNYVFIKNSLGSTINRSFKIGNLSVKAGQTYDSFVLDNGLVQTDVEPELPFHAPVVLADFNSYSATRAKVATPKQAPVVAKPTTTATSKSAEIEKPKVDIQAVLRKFDLSDALQNELAAFNATLNPRLANYEFGLHVTNGLYTGGMFLSNNANGTSMELGDAIADPNIPQKLKIIIGRANAELSKALSTGVTVETKPAEAKKVTEAKSAKDVLAEDSPFGPARAVSYAVGSYTPMNTKKAVEWLKKRLPKGVSIELIETFIKLGDTQAFGLAKPYAVILAEAAEVGSEYHEAFHQISLGIFTPRERMLVYEKARKIYGLDEMSDKAVEEYLAERFREFVMAEDKAAVSLSTTIKRFFQKLFDFIYTFFTGEARLSDHEIGTIFDAINRGAYRYVKPTNTGFEAYSPAGVVRGRTGFSATNAKTIVKNIVYYAFKLNDVAGVKDVDKIKFAPVKNKFIAIREAHKFDMNKYKAEGNEQLAAVSEDLYNKFVAITEPETWQAFEELADDYLLSLKIRGRDINIEDSTAPEDNEDNKNGDQATENNLDKKSYETDLKDNMLAAMKMLIMTLPESTEHDQFTQLFSFVDFASTWSSLIYDLYKYDNIDDMLSVLKAKGKNILAYAELAKKLEAKGAENLKTQFEVSFRKYRHAFVDWTYEYNEGTGTLKSGFQSSDVQNAAKLLTKEWGVQFAKSDLIDEKTRALNIERMRHIFREYREVLSIVKQATDKGLPYDYVDVSERIIKVFNELSIPLDQHVLAFIMADKDQFVTKEQAFADFIINDISTLFGDNSTLVARAKSKSIKNNKGQLLKDEDIFTNEKAIRVTLAGYYIKAKPDELLTTILGPDGNIYYVYANNSVLADNVRELQNNPDWSKSLLAVTGNNNSVFLKQMVANDSIRKSVNLKTSSNFVRLGVADAGKDYSALNDTEDFLFKLDAIHKGFKTGNSRKGYLPLPSLADRTTYQLLDGLELPEFKPVLVGGKIVLPRESEAVNILLGYVKDEMARIELVKKQVDEALAKKDTSKLVENFHYKVKTRDKLKGAKVVEKIDDNLFKVFKSASGEYVGNGAKFMHFGDLNNKSVDLTNDQALRSYIIKHLIDRISDTIKHAADLGLITAHIATSKFWVVDNNLLVDTELVNSIAAKEFGGSVKNAIYKILGNYTLNTIVSSIETEKMFIGDMAYFKDDSVKATAEDKIKRLSVLMSTGDNLRTVFPEKHELYGKTSYNSAFLNSNIIASVWYDNLFEAFITYYENSGMTKEQAKDEATERLFKYKKVDQTDAQAYVSADMYRSIQIRLGEWDNDKQKAFEILQAPGAISKEKELEALALVMPPLKLVSFGKTITDNLAIPTFDKMSMAPLFRRMVRGTALEDLVDRMELKGAYEGVEGLEPIDMLRFDTATKVGNRDRKAFMKKDGTTADLSGIKLFPQQFKDLRRQQITDPHDVERSLLGTQVRKVVMSNIELDGDYVFKGESMKGKELANTIMDCMNKLSTIGKEEMMKELGIEFKEGRHMISNKSKLFKTLLQDAKRSGMADTVIEALQVNIDGQPYLPIDAMPDRKWVQSRLISAIAKYTVDLKLPGNSFIQMSNYGFRNKYKDFDKQKDLITWLKEDSRDLKFYRVKDGRTQPMECVVSVSLFKHVIPNYDKLTFGEKAAFVKNNPLILGYRIPTQGLNSVSVLKVVGLLPEQIGDTIMLPAEFTSLTGSDFDIDKLYAVRYNYAKDATSPDNVRRISSKSETREGIENRLLDAYFSILLDPKHFTQLTTPLDAATDKVKDIASNIEKLEGRNFIPETMYIDSPVYQSLVKSKYIGGKLGIGPFALNNVHHVLGQLTGLYFKGDIGVGNVDKEANITRLDGKKGIDGEYILDWLSALINAHVDIAKDPYIFDLNVNSYTYNVTNFLIRAGVGGEKTFYFLAQPILKELAKLGAKKKQEGLGVIADSEYRILIEKYKELRNAALYKAGKKLDEAKEDFKEWLSKSGEEGLFNVKTLTKDIAAKGEGDYIYYMRQLAILSKYRDLNNKAFSLNNVVMFSRLDTKKYGNNLTDVELYARGVDKILDDKNMGNVDRLLQETFLETYYDNNIQVVQDIFKDITIAGTDTFYKVVDMITNFSGATDPNSIKKIMGTVSDALLTNVAAKFFADSEIGLGMTKEKVKKLFYSNDGLIDKIAAIRSGSLYPELKDNRLIKILRTEVQEEGSTKPNIIRVYSTNIKEKWDRDDISRAWEDLINHENEEIRKIGRGLVVYAFYTSGFKKNIYSFFQFIPTSYLHDIGYGDHMNSYLDNLNNEDNLMDLFNFVEEIFVNGWNHKHLVPVFNGFRANALDHKGRTLMFQMNSAIGEDYLVGFNEHKEPIFRPYIKLGSYREAPLYKYVGYVADPITKNPSPVYLITSKKSYYDAGVVIIENMLNGTMFTSNDPGLTAEELKSINAHLTDTITTPKGYNNKYKGFKSMSIENMMVDEKVTETLREEKIKAAEEAAMKAEEDAEKVVEQPSVSAAGEEPMRPDLYENYSGGADGADSLWDEIGREFGVVDHTHFYHGKKTPKGNEKITDEMLEIGWQHVLEANRTLKRKPEGYKSLLSRNWYQVENSAAVFAIGEIDRSQYTLFGTQVPVVKGGTGWAVQMAIDSGTRVYIFDQTVEKWYTFSNGTFIEIETPVLTGTFAGIGTRKINDAGKQAIRDVYEKTFSKKEPTIADNIPTFKDSQEAAYAIDPLVGKPMKTGTIIKVGESLFTVVNEENQDINLIPVETTTAEEIYSRLGNKTQSENVVIDEVNGRKPAVENNLPTKDVKINIYAGANQNTELSNFAIRPFKTNVETSSGSKEYTFQSVEQGFHFYKAVVANTPQVAAQILKTTNGGTLRNLTNRSNLKMTPEQVKEWDDTSKSIMLNLMYDSYAQNPDKAQLLLNTGEATITHTQDNTRWKTDFPEVVMTVRDMLREEGFDKNQSSKPIVAYRTRGNNFLEALEKDNAIGNPFGPYGQFKTPAGREAVEEFIAWMIGEKHTDKLQDYRQAIIDKIPELRSKTILYYKDLGRPSHATALDYLINKYDWEMSEESPFLSDAEIRAKNTPQIIFSTEPEAVAARVKELGIIDFNNITDEQMQDLRDKYAHCK